MFPIFPDNLNIVIRCRPGGTSCLPADVEGHTEVLPAGTAEEQEHLRSSLKRLICGIKPGGGATMIASGACGSGKSSVMGMLPAANGKVVPDSGLVHMALSLIFSGDYRVDGQPAASVSLRCFEVLGDEAYDLLAEDGCARDGTLKQHLQQQERLRRRVARHTSLLVDRSAAAAGLLRSTDSMRQSFIQQSSGSKHQAWHAPPPSAAAAASVGSSLAASPSALSPSTPSPCQPGKPLQVLSLSSVAAASEQKAAAAVAHALAGRCSTESFGRPHCHHSHAAVRISWTCPASSKSSGGGAPPLQPPRGDPAPACGARQTSRNIFPPPSSGGGAHATGGALCTLTLVDCCSGSAAGLLPERYAAASKLSLMSLGRALGKVSLGETAMGLRETQLTRALIGSVDAVVLLACLGGTIDVPAAAMAGHHAVGMPPGPLGAPISPLAVAAAADEATAHLVRNLVSMRRRRESGRVKQKSCGGGGAAAAALPLGPCSRSRRSSMTVTVPSPQLALSPYPLPPLTQAPQASASISHEAANRDRLTRLQQLTTSQVFASGGTRSSGGAEGAGSSSSAITVLAPLKSRERRPPPPRLSLPEALATAGPVRLPEGTRSPRRSPAAESASPRSAGGPGEGNAGLVAYPRTPSSTSSVYSMGGSCRWSQQGEACTPPSGMRPRWPPPSCIPRAPVIRLGDSPVTQEVAAVFPLPSPAASVSAALDTHATTTTGLAPASPPAKSPRSPRWAPADRGVATADAVQSSGDIRITVKVVTDAAAAAASAQGCMMRSSRSPGLKKPFPGPLTPSPNKRQNISSKTPPPPAGFRCGTDASKTTTAPGPSLATPTPPGPPAPSQSPERGGTRLSAASAERGRAPSAPAAAVFPGNVPGSRSGSRFDSPVSLSFCTKPGGVPAKTWWLSAVPLLEDPRRSQSAMVHHGLPTGPNRLRLEELYRSLVGQFEDFRKTAFRPRTSEGGLSLMPGSSWTPAAARPLGGRQRAAAAAPGKGLPKAGEEHLRRSQSSLTVPWWCWDALATLKGPLPPGSGDTRCGDPLLPPTEHSHEDEEADDDGNDETLFSWHLPDPSMLARTVGASFELGEAAGKATDGEMAWGGRRVSAAPRLRAAVAPPARMRSPSQQRAPGRRTSPAGSARRVSSSSLTLRPVYGAPINALPGVAANGRQPPALISKMSARASIHQREPRALAATAAATVAAAAGVASGPYSLHQQRHQQQVITDMRAVGGARSSAAPVRAPRVSRATAPGASPAKTSFAAPRPPSAVSSLALRQQMALQLHVQRAAARGSKIAGRQGNNLQQQRGPSSWSGSQAKSAARQGPQHKRGGICMASRSDSLASSACSELPCSSMLLDKALRLPANCGLTSAVPPDKRLLPLPAQLRRVSRPEVPAAAAPPRSTARVGAEKRDAADAAAQELPMCGSSTLLLAHQILLPCSTTVPSGELPLPGLTARLSDDLPMPGSTTMVLSEELPMPGSATLLAQEQPPPGLATVPLEELPMPRSTSLLEQPQSGLATVLSQELPMPSSTTLLAQEQPRPGLAALPSEELPMPGSTVLLAQEPPPPGLATVPSEEELPMPGSTVLLPLPWSLPAKVTSVAFSMAAVSASPVTVATGGGAATEVAAAVVACPVALFPSHATDDAQHDVLEPQEGTSASLSFGRAPSLSRGRLDTSAGGRSDGPASTRAAAAAVSLLPIAVRCDTIQHRNSDLDSDADVLLYSQAGYELAHAEVPDALEAAEVAAPKPVAVGVTRGAKGSSGTMAQFMRHPWKWLSKVLNLKSSERPAGGIDN